MSKRRTKPPSCVWNYCTELSEKTVNCNFCQVTMHRNATKFMEHLANKCGGTGLAFFRNKCQTSVIDMVIPSIVSAGEAVGDQLNQSMSQETSSHGKSIFNPMTGVSVHPFWDDSPSFIEEGEARDSPTPDFGNVPKNISSQNKSCPPKRRQDSDSENMSEAMGVVSHCKRKFKEKNGSIVLSPDVQAYVTLLGIKLDSLPKRKRTNLQSKWFKEICDAEISDSE